jgi:hypothetical protein
LIPVGDQYHDFSPGSGQGADVALRVIQSPGHIRIGIHRVHKPEPAHNGFQVPHTLQAAGNFEPGGSGKGKQVEGIADTDKFPEKGTGKIIRRPLIGDAHACGGVEDQHQINRPLVLRAEGEKV